VTNLTRRDGEEFLSLAPEVPVHTRVAPFPLAEANEALDSLREGRFSGAAVIVIDEPG
jgi:propanol-preferring alcohol dehydrogenase